LRCRTRARCPSWDDGCHELRIVDAGVSWRIVYHLRLDAVVILAVFAKKTRRTPVQQIEASRDRLRRYLKDLGAR
jgi:phage-related protein